MAMATHLCRCLEHTRAQTLTGHFHQAKARYPANLYARTIRFQAILDPLFNRRVVPAVFHVDKIDHDQASKIAQAQLTCNFFCRFKIRFRVLALAVELENSPTYLDGFLPIVRFEGFVSLI